MCRNGEGASITAPVVIPGRLDDEDPQSRFDHLNYFEIPIICLRSFATLGTTR